MTPPDRRGQPVALRGSRRQLRSEESQLASVSNDVDRLDDLAAHGEHEDSGQLVAEEGEDRRLAANRLRDQCRALTPEAQQVPGDAQSASYQGRHSGGARTQVDIAPGVRGEDLQQAGEVAVGARGNWSDEQLAAKPIPGTAIPS